MKTRENKWKIKIFENSEKAQYIGNLLENIKKNNFSGHL